MAQAKLDIGYGTGNPNGFPDFKPINPWGRMPERKRLMPHPNQFIAPEVDLYQMWADDRENQGKPVALFPRMPRDVLLNLLEVVNAQISLGNEKRFANPRLEQCVSILAKGH